MRFIIFVVFTLSVALTAGRKSPPAISDQYYVNGTFFMPGGKIAEPFEAWYDAVGNRQVFSYYNGMDVFISLFAENASYSITPVITTVTCFESPACGGPMANGRVGDGGCTGMLINVFPDLTQPGWKYSGNTEIRDVAVEIWQLATSNYSRAGLYSFYVTPSGVPLRYEMNGVNTIWGAHPDLYILDYWTFQPNLNGREDAFAVPELCTNASASSHAPSQGNLAVALSAAATDLGQRTEETESAFHEFLAKHGKQYESLAEYRDRLAIFRASHARIRAHNARFAQGQISYDLAMNHFGDFSDAEFKSKIIPRPQRPKSNGAGFTHEASAAALPTEIDWRLKNAVTYVKDQGVCGSCWTFGSTGSLEGVYAIKTGRLLSLSEQQLLDCSWSTENIADGNQGCDGGFASFAYQWIIDNGGIALETSYPYLMQNGMCKAAVHDSGISVKAYVNVTMSDEAALQDAVATVGPVAIAIDASMPDFRYYSSGVYYNAECKSDLDDLDHEVLAVGYGTDATTGRDYWIVKNSWSMNWGSGGFVLMARNANNNCGIATQATYPIVA